MRIAFILPSLANKGPVIMVKQLIGYLIKANHQCDVYYFDEIEEIDFPCSTAKINFFDAIAFGNYQVVHSHLFRPDLYCWYHRRLIHKEIKLISTLHTSIYEDLAHSHGYLKSRLVIPLWEMALKTMNHVVVLNQEAKRYYQHLKFKNSGIINNGLSLPEIIEPIPDEDLSIIRMLKKNHILLGSVCAIDKRKGLEQVISLLVKEPTYAYIIVGDGAEGAKLQDLAIARGVDDRFKILGFRAQGFRYHAHFSLSMLPSRSEGMPMALLEAMALRVPIVCANIPSIAKEFSSEEITYFNLDQVESLATSCREALLTASEKPSKAYQRYHASFTVSKMGERYLKLYNSGFIFDFN